MKKVRAVLDTDTFNEADDQFALAYALRSADKISLEAVYAAPFFNGRVQSAREGMEKSYEEILKIFSLLGENPEGRVFRGSEEFLSSKLVPVESEAAKDLVKRVKSNSEPLYVVCIAALTNVISAVLMDPSIIKNMVVVWLGGHPHYWKQTWEFNLKGDFLAAQVLFECGVPLVQIPCMGVASNLITTEYELEHYLNKKSDIGTYLTKNICGFAKDHVFFGEYNEIVDRYLEGSTDYPDDICGKVEYTEENYAYSKIIWDISAVAYLINPAWVRTITTKTPELNENYTWEFTEINCDMRVCTYMKRDCVFGDLFYKLGAGASKKEDSERRIFLPDRLPEQRPPDRQCKRCRGLPLPPRPVRS
jgi:inosine-uridine nucleoside N-ribohydrolase